MLRFFFCRLPIRLVLLLALAIAGLPRTASAADALRCGSRLVAVEDRAAELVSVCGEPSYRDRWSPYEAGGGSFSFVGDTEEWTYNFGASQLLRIVRLRNGRIVDITSDGHGFREPGPQERSCSPERLIEGLSKYRLLVTCGEPLTRTAVSLFRPDRRFDGRPVRPGAVVAVFREEWVYDFGPNLLIRIVTLENGRVVDIENGGRGRAR